MSRWSSHVHPTPGHSTAAVSALRHCRAGTSFDAYGLSVRQEGQCKACHAITSGARPAITVTVALPVPSAAPNPSDANSRATARAAPWSGKPERGGRLESAPVVGTDEESADAKWLHPVARASPDKVTESSTAAGGRSKNKNKCEKPTLRCQRTQESTTDVPSAVSGT